MTLEFDVERHDPACAPSYDVTVFQHAVCRDRVEAERAVQAKAWEAQRHAEWAAEHPGEPYPELNFHVIPSTSFRIESESLMHYPFPQTKILEDNRLPTPTLWGRLVNWFNYVVYKVCGN